MDNVRQTQLLYNPPVMSLRCFIAMAFDREDTDEVYERMIVPVLRNLHISPIRVDRVEHNDDIDKRIIQEIEAADFAIADLTYARPSVYFEAGYAQRMIPVIYTSRSDHLHPRADDLNGNLRVHFDLQMRNIVTWNEPGDYEFSQGLDRRIRKVIQPILKAVQRTTANREQVQRFKSLSLAARLERVKTQGLTRLRRSGFHGTQRTYRVRGTPYLIAHYDPYRTQFDLISSQLESYWVGVKLLGSVLHVSTLVVIPSLTKKIISAIHDDFLTRISSSVNLVAGGTFPSALVEHVYICSLKAESLSKLATVLHDFDHDANQKYLTGIREMDIPIRMRKNFNEVYWHVNQGREELKFENSDTFEKFTNYGFEFRRLNSNQRIPSKRISRHLHVHLIDQIESEESFKDRFSEAIAVDPTQQA